VLFESPLLRAQMLLHFPEEGVDQGELVRVVLYEIAARTARCPNPLARADVSVGVQGCLGMYSR
jgi:hypothetical protein